MKILGISGHKGAGKDTVAESLQDFWPCTKPSIIRFAGSVKEIVARVVFAKAKFVEGMKYETVHGRTGTEWLQLIGTDWFRNELPDCWVNCYKATVNAIVEWGIENDLGEHCIVLTPDVRFPNEVKAIHDLGGHVIRLTRTPFPEDKHESETALDECEHISGKFLAGMKFIKPTSMELFDAITDNANMTVDECNKAVLELVQERGWV
jgi:hypothetical protein